MHAFEVTQDDVANVLFDMKCSMSISDAMEAISGHEGEIEKIALAEVGIADQTDAAYGKIREILEGVLSE